VIASESLRNQHEIASQLTQKRCAIASQLRRKHCAIATHGIGAQSLCDRRVLAAESLRNYRAIA
jgi:hypothetical protein